MELTPANTALWLGRHGVALHTGRFTELGGGVSNRVILAETASEGLVVKQSLGRLRVEWEWLSDRSRIFREAAAMRWLEGRVRGGRLPRLLFEAPEDFAIAMESAPSGSAMWKSKLFAGDLNPAHARAAGSILGSVIAASWRNAEAARLFGDQTVFDQLRLEPYYRFTALRHPEQAPWFHALLERTGSRRVSLVHGDWSPKNLLVAPGQGRLSPNGTRENSAEAEGGEVWAIDWEVIHFGDPSFDVGFLLNHLLLKSIAFPALRACFGHLAAVFDAALRDRLPADASWVPEAGLEHLPGLLLARVDGKSPAEYLDDAMRVRARSLALDLMARPAASIAEVFER